MANKRLETLKMKYQGALNPMSKMEVQLKDPNKIFPDQELVIPK